MKKRMLVSLLLIAALFVMLLPTAYAEQGKVEGNNYYFTDRNGDKLEVTMPDRTLFVDGKPMGGIPSLAGITE